VGELVVRSPSLFSGYWERRELTNEVLRNGWFSTGDAGVIDEHGYVHIVGQLADTIQIGAEPVHTYQLERVLEQVPGVAECAAFGYGEPGRRQSVGAAIVLRPGAATTAAQVMKFCESALPAGLRPTRLWFLDSLPRSHSGQIMRHRLKAQIVEVAALPEPSTNGALRHH
jgi:long-chain acyl-CoA synthetase